MSLQGFRRRDMVLFVDLFNEIKCFTFPLMYPTKISNSQPLF